MWNDIADLSGSLSVSFWITKNMNQIHQTVTKMSMVVSAISVQKNYLFWTIFYQGIWNHIRPHIFGQKFAILAIMNGVITLLKICTVVKFNQTCSFRPPWSAMLTKKGNAEKIWLTNQMLLKKYIININSWHLWSLQSFLIQFLIIHKYLIYLFLVRCNI